MAMTLLLSWSRNFPTISSMQGFISCWSTSYLAASTQTGVTGIFHVNSQFCTVVILYMKVTGTIPTSVAGVETTNRCKESHNFPCWLSMSHKLSMHDHEKCQPVICRYTRSELPVSIPDPMLHKISETWDKQGKFQHLQAQTIGGTGEGDDINRTKGIS